MSIITIIVRELLYFFCLLNFWHFYPDKVRAFPLFFTLFGEEGFRTFYFSMRVILFIIEEMVGKYLKKWNFVIRTQKPVPPSQYKPGKSVSHGKSS